MYCANAHITTFSCLLSLLGPMVMRLDRAQSCPSRTDSDYAHTYIQSSPQYRSSSGNDVPDWHSRPPCMPYSYMIHCFHLHRQRPGTHWSIAIEINRLPTSQARCAPSASHRVRNTRDSMCIWNVRGRMCEVYGAPFAHLLCPEHLSGPGLFCSANI